MNLEKRKRIIVQRTVFSLKLFYKIIFSDMPPKNFIGKLYETIPGNENALHFKLFMI